MPRSNHIIHNFDHDDIIYHDPMARALSEGGGGGRRSMPPVSLDTHAIRFSCLVWIGSLTQLLLSSKRRILMIMKWAGSDCHPTCVWV